MAAPHGASSRARPALVLAGALLLGGLAALLGGCNGALLNGYYLLEPVQRAYTVEEFNSTDWGQWDYGPGEGLGNSWVIEPGYFISLQPTSDSEPSWLTWRDDLPGDIEARLEFEVWYAPGMSMSENGFGYDYRFVLADPAQMAAGFIGPAVQLSLNQGGITQAVTIGQGFNFGTSGDAYASINTAAPVERGTIDVVFLRNTAVPRIDVTVTFAGESTPLTLTHDVPDSWTDPVKVHVEAVGYYDGTGYAPRVIDSLLLLQPEAW